jgi:hypothetical protein
VTGDSWVVRGTAEYKGWYDGLSQEEQDAVLATIEHLRQEGPALRRPLSGKITGSRHANMKELIPPVPRAKIRILYAFDPMRRAILLIGGDKTNDWIGWYQRNIPVADEIYDRHLAAVKAMKAEEQLTVGAAGTKRKKR